MYSRPSGSYPLSRTYFSEIFLEKYKPRIHRDHLRVLFSRFEYGSMIVLEYESHFHELSMHGTFILNFEYEKFYCIVRGFRLPIGIATKTLVVVGRSFYEVLDQARMMEEMHCESY